MLERARRAGVECMICIGERIETSRQAVALAARHADVRAVVGIHPQNDALYTDACLPELEQLASEPGVVAIGEIGLDYHWPGFDVARQIACFVPQAHLAGRLGLPIVFHCRDAYDDLLKMIQADALIPRRGVMHCFGGTLEQARAFIDLGFHIGIGCASTYPNAAPLRELVAAIGPARVIAETDAPYLPPQSRRDMRNEAAHVRFAIRELANVWGMTFQEAAGITRANTCELFGIELNRETNTLPDDEVRIDIGEGEAVEAILERIGNPARWRRIVLGDAGEPTIAWNELLAVAQRLHADGGKVWIATDGRADQREHTSLARALAGLLEGVQIKLPPDANPAHPDWNPRRDFAAAMRDVAPVVELCLEVGSAAEFEACRRLAEETLEIKLRICPPR